MTANDWVIIASVVRSLEKAVARQEEYLDRLTDYAKEIDPRFDEERRLIADLNESVEKGETSLAGMQHMDLVKEKKARGERTLLDPI
jgi:hypothetical protein